MYTDSSIGMETATNSAGSQPRSDALQNRPDVPVKPITAQQDSAEVVNIGTKCSVKNLYELSGQTVRQQINWTEKYPDDLGVAAESAETALHALLVRNKRSGDNSKKVLMIDSIVVQSPFLKLALAPVLENYPGITTELERLTFTMPFHPLIHRWTDLERAVRDEKDTVTKEHLDLFYQILHNEVKDTIAEIKDLLSHNVITFNLLWAIFRPGDLIFSLDNGKEACFELKNGHYTMLGFNRVFALNVEQIEWSGTTFGRVGIMKYIYPFGGTKPVTQLQHFPFSFHPDEDEIRNRLISRGKMFQNLKGYHYKSYDGTATGGQIQGGSRKFNASGRVIIDAQAYHRFSGIPKPNVTSLVQVAQDPKDATHQNIPAVQMQAQQRRTLVHRHAHASTPMAAGNQNVQSSMDDEVIDENMAPLTDEQLILTSCMVKGYSMKAKSWALFFVNSIGEITWSDNAFESLVLPGAHKQLILAFAEGQLNYEKMFDDIIQGKGKGIILLLSGPPGVGKTLTAESVSEVMRVPLYSMSAGDLGLNPVSLETELSRILEMVTKWNAILLLDEADVFLEQRSAHDLERNKLVSIFLRVLEYYQGILFLTTNRVQTFDAAFHSRIHVSINYPELDAASRRKVWANFLSIGGVEKSITESDLDELAEIGFNGRQIKNIVKTAGLIAMRNGEPLRVEHIRLVIGVIGNNNLSGSTS